MLPMSGRTPTAPERPSAAGPSPIVGLLIDSLEDSYQWSVLRGAMDAARRTSALACCALQGSPRSASGRGRGAQRRLRSGRPAERRRARRNVGCDRQPHRARAPGPILRSLPAAPHVQHRGRARRAVERLHRQRERYTRGDRPPGTVHGKKRIAFVRGPIANAEAERTVRGLQGGARRQRYRVLAPARRRRRLRTAGGRDAVRALLRRQQIDIRE